MDRPIFEVESGDKHYKIYENGTIDGFPKDAFIINRIQIVFFERMAEFLKKLEEGEEGE